tara:strand:+ start:8858 stop:9577 length:720 start_codon:yes stop_codon:yes gene_type:complete
MSWLGLDFGSTNLKAALFKNNTLYKKIGKIDFTEPLPDDLKDEFDSVLVSSSKSEGTTNALIGGLQLNKKIIKVSDVLPSEDVCVHDYGEPAFGEDRRLYFLAMKNMTSDNNFGVISLGTVCTLSVWTKDTFYGGNLFPGRTSIYKTLGRVTSLPEIEPNVEMSFGRGSSCVSSVRSGIDMGWIAMIKELKSLYDSELDNIAWFATGGDYNCIANHIKDECVNEPDLLWKGMEALISKI